MDSIYGNHCERLRETMKRLLDEIEAIREEIKADTGMDPAEHCLGRIKSEESMREKCRRQGLPETEDTALRLMHDAIGIRVVCAFIDDVYENIALIKSLPGCTVIKEKDYIQDSKPNGYRSYHMILDVETDAVDVDGNNPGHYFVEVQLRTIAMDTWAALEHELKYKKDIANPELIAQELHRCANELASCDVSMQTLRRIIRGI